MAEMLHSDWGARGPGFESPLRQGFVCLLKFRFVVNVFIFFVLSKQNIIYSNFANLFEMLIHLVYLTYCNLCGRLKGFQDTDLASFIK